MRAAASISRSARALSGRRPPVNPADRRNMSSGIVPGSKNLDWENLGFAYVPTDCMMTCTYKDGKWGEFEVQTEPYFHLHAFSNILHYGQGVFEGLKAHCCADGKVRVFNSDMNHERMANGANRLGMPEVPLSLFTEGVDAVVSKNLGYVPPYGKGGSLYLRPLLFGQGPQLGLGTAPEYTFAVMCAPVGAYYKSGLKAVKSLVIDEYDRAAPYGVGNVKCPGNYAADVRPAKEAAEKGYPIALYLDAKERKYIEEFSTSNFVAIDAKGNYITPKSDSILPSTTNKVLMKIAPSIGIDVEERPVAWEEVPTLKEVAACGTAVVLTPIKSITRSGTDIEFGELDSLYKLYTMVKSLQVGEIEDQWGLTRLVE
uniref:Branched-chain-amino-acid transaminase n=1 Tax=Lotharella globosa TaxID=91324 RepID=A0A7S4DST9_9EUKA